MKHCIISFVDPAGIRHSVEIQADSMYEAAVAGLEVFHQHHCAPGLAGELEVQVQSAVTHSVTVKKLIDWAAFGGGSPKEVLLKRRVKVVMAGAAAPGGRG